MSLWTRLIKTSATNSLLYDLSKKIVRNAKGSWSIHLSFRRKLVIEMKNINKLDPKNIDKILTDRQLELYSLSIQPMKRITIHQDKNKKFRRRRTNINRWNWKDSSKRKMKLKQTSVIQKETCYCNEKYK